MVGGLLLAVSLFIAWYHVENRNAVLAGTQGPASITGFDAHSILRWLLLAAAAAPFILAWIIVRNHTLSWPRGQLTSVVAIAAFGLLLYNGVIDRPGDPSSLIGLRLGWLAALLGTLLMLSGSFMRQQETEVRRKPPGTI
jgi:hypothetical protein